MPAATTKDELLEVVAKEFQKLSLVLEQVGEELVLAKDDDDTSVKDIVSHRAHWIGLFLGWYHDGLAGKKVHFPAEGYKWNELKRYNADLRTQHADMSWSEACTRLQHANTELTAFIQAKTNEELYGGPMTGANNQWTPGRWAEAAGPSHYRSASKYIRQRVRAAG